MQTSLHRIATNVKLAIGLATVAGNAAGAFVSAMLTIWLLLFHNVFANCLAIGSAGAAIGFGLDACLAYLAARPELTPAQRQHYLDSNLLYNPEKREAERRRRAEPRDF